MSKDCQRLHGDSVRTQLFWAREDLVKAQTEIERLTSESRTHKARADLNFDENERLRHDLSRSVEATTQHLNEVKRLRAELDLAITQLGDRPSHTNCRFAKDTLRRARGEIVAGDMQGSCLSAEAEP